MEFFHTGLTVSNLNEAKDFFSQIFALEVTSERELSGPYLAHMLGYDCELTARIAMLETSPTTFIELVEYTDTNHVLPGPNAVGRITQSGTPHFAFFVDNLEKFHEDHGTNLLEPMALEPDTIPGGPFAGGHIRFYRSRFGCLIEVIQRPTV